MFNIFPKQETLSASLLLAHLQRRTLSSAIAAASNLNIFCTKPQILSKNHNLSFQSRFSALTIFLYKAFSNSEREKISLIARF